MVRLKSVLSITSIIVISLSSSLVSSRPLQRAEALKGRVFEQHWAEFRYVIYRNEVSDSSRRLYVLLDLAAFSEDTLKKLFDLLSKRFPTPEWLDVWVATSLQQARTPEEVDEGLAHDMGDDPHDEMYPGAVLIRLKGNELIRYTIGSGPRFYRLKTVILKGEDPFAPATRPPR
jgi:hypothetical protein